MLKQPTISAHHKRHLEDKLIEIKKDLSTCESDVSSALHTSHGICHLGYDIERMKTNKKQHAEDDSLVKVYIIDKQ